MNLKPKELIEIGVVQRYHTLPSPFPQSIAHHSWNAVQIYRVLCPEPKLAVIEYLLDHDMPEKIMGDIPADGKWAHPTLADAVDRVEKIIEADWGVFHNLTMEERHWAKAMDLLELVLWTDYLVTHFGALGFDAVMQRGLGALNAQWVPKEVTEWLTNH